LRVRFPDSEIRGSEGARPYSRLIAACYVLHRLCAPRHPPDALALTLDRSAFVPCPEKSQARDDPKIVPCADRFPSWMYAIRLSVFRINRLCEPANLAFTCQRNRSRDRSVRASNCFSVEFGIVAGCSRAAAPHGVPAGTAGQASRGGAWWSRSGSNRRPQACKARALPTELRPRASWDRESRIGYQKIRCPIPGF
jgi:hypothetical protein